MERGRRDSPLVISRTQPSSVSSFVSLLGSRISGIRFRRLNRIIYPPKEAMEHRADTMEFCVSSSKDGALATAGDAGEMEAA